MSENKISFNKIVNKNSIWYNNYMNNQSKDKLKILYKLLKKQLNLSENPKVDILIEAVELNNLSIPISGEDCFDSGFIITYNKSTDINKYILNLKKIYKNEIKLKIKDNYYIISYIKKIKNKDSNKQSLLLLMF
jgi:hypothetical protein